MPEGKRGLEDKQGGRSHRSRGGRGPEALRGPRAETHLSGRASCSQGRINGGRLGGQGTHRFAQPGLV